MAFSLSSSGSAREWNAGWTYGRATSDTREDHHLPVTLVRTFLTPEASHLHSSDLGPDLRDGRHECYLLFPAGINPGGVEKTRSHWLDVEVGVMAGVVGVEAGVSFGEALDFVLGVFRFSDRWTFLDFGDDDDPEARAAKRVWQRVNRHEGPPDP